MWQSSPVSFRESQYEVLLIALVNVILVLGSERLYSDLARRFASYKTGKGEEITLVKLDKSGGCVDRDDEFMRRIQEAATREYFFGDLKRTLSPHTQLIGFDEAIIYKIQEGALVSNSSIDNR